MEVVQVFGDMVDMLFVFVLSPWYVMFIECSWISSRMKQVSLTEYDKRFFCQRQTNMIPIVYLGKFEVHLNCDGIVRDISIVKMSSNHILS